MIKLIEETWVETKVLGEYKRDVTLQQHLEATWIKPNKAPDGDLYAVFDDGRPKTLLIVGKGGLVSTGKSAEGIREMTSLILAYRFAEARYIAQRLKDECNFPPPRKTDG